MVALFGAIVLTLLLGLWVFVRQPTTPPRTDLPANVVVSEQQRALNELLMVQPTAALEEKIFVYDSGLLSDSIAVARERLEEGLHLPVEILRVPGITSRQAIVDLTPRLRTPPQYFVVDLGRFDRAAGIQENEMTLNLTSIVQKILDLGGSAMVIGSLSSDGNTRFAETVRAILPGSAKFIDATPLLLTPSFRMSPTELNAEGARKLAEQLIAAFPRTSP